MMDHLKMLEKINLLLDFFYVKDWLSLNIYKRRIEVFGYNYAECTEFFIKNNYIEPVCIKIWTKNPFNKKDPEKLLIINKYF